MIYHQLPVGTAPEICIVLQGTPTDLDGITTVELTLTRKDGSTVQLGVDEVAFDRSTNTIKWVVGDEGKEPTQFTLICRVSWEKGYLDLAPIGYKITR